MNDGLLGRTNSRYNPERDDTPYMTTRSDPALLCPLPSFPIIRDLVVDKTNFFHSFDCVR